jgi:tape measure domain-containing protein
MESKISVKFTGDASDVKRQLEDLTKKGHNVSVTFKGDTSQVVRDAAGIESRKVTSRVEFTGNSDSIKKLQGDIERSKTTFTVTPNVDGAALGRIRESLREVATGALREIGANLVDGIGNSLKSAISTAGDAAKFSMEKSIERQNLLLASSVAYKGNMEASGKAIKESIDYANRTPFKTQSVGAADTAYKLATGQERSKAQREEVGNVAALVMTAGRESADEAYKNISNIYTRIQSEGRVTNEALSRLSERGVDIYGALGKQLSLTNAEVRKLASDGKLTADEFQKAFTKLAGPGSALDGLAKGLGETTGGKLSTFQDSLETAGVAMGNAFAPAINSVLDLGTTIVNEIASSSAFDDIAAQAKQFTDEIANNPELVKEITEAAVELSRMGLELCLEGMKAFVNVVKDPDTPNKINGMLEGFKLVLEVIKAMAEALVNSIKLVQDLATEASKLAGNREVEATSTDLAWDGNNSASISGVKMPTNIAAFIEMFRVGEGTEGDEGYKTMFTSKKFDSFADHPRQLQTSGNLTSDAAGMPQFLSTTWDGVKNKIGAKDFSPANQVKGAIQLIKDRGAYDDLLRGDLNSALDKLSHEWASLPTGTSAQSGRWGQPAKTGPEAERIYKEKLAMFNSSNPSRPKPESPKEEIKSGKPVKSSSTSPSFTPTNSTNESTPVSTASKKASRFKIWDSSEGHEIKNFDDVSGHHKNSRHKYPDREYSNIGGKSEEVETNSLGQKLIKKDFVMEDDKGSRDAPMITAVSGYVGSAGQQGWGEVEVFADRARKVLIARFGHMKNILVKTGEFVEAGQQVGTQSDVGSPGSNHSHVEYREQDWDKGLAVLKGQPLKGGKRDSTSRLMSDQKAAEREEEKKKQEAERKRQEALKVASAEDKARYQLEDAELTKKRATRDSQFGTNDGPTQEVTKLSDKFEDATIKTGRAIKALEADSKERPTYKKANDTEIQALKADLESERLVHENALKLLQTKLEDTAKQETLRLEVDIKAEQSKTRQVSAARALANLTSQAAKDNAILNIEYSKLKDSYEAENASINEQITKLDTLIASYEKAGLKTDALNKQKDLLLSLQSQKAKTYGEEIGVHLDTKERADKAREKAGKDYLSQFQAIPGDNKSKYIGATQGIDAENAYNRRVGKAQIEAQYKQKGEEANQQYQDGNINAEQLAGVNRELTELKNADLSALNRQFKTLGETIAESVSKELGDAFTSILDGSKSVEEAVTGMLKNLAKQFLQMAVNKMMTSLFGGLLGGSNGINLMTGSSGINNYATGKGSYSPSIGQALERERLQSGGRQPYLAVLNTDEIVLNPQQSKELMSTGSVTNFANGNLTGLKSFSQGGTNLNLTVNNTGSGSMTPEQLKSLGSTLTNLVDSRISNATRPGGLLR